MATHTHTASVEIMRPQRSARHITDEMNIQRAAEIFIERFGKDAPREAAIRMDELRESGDTDGHDLWQKFTNVSAISSLRGSLRSS